MNKYLSSENPLFFELRARYLIACERIPEAMALIKSCINHPDIGKDLYFHQALFTCLFMSPVEDQLFREVFFFPYYILLTLLKLKQKPLLLHFMCSNTTDLEITLSKCILWWPFFKLMWISQNLIITNDWINTLYLLNFWYDPDRN